MIVVVNRGKISKAVFLGNKNFLYNTYNECETRSLHKNEIRRIP